LAVKVLIFKLGENFCSSRAASEAQLVQPAINHSPGRQVRQYGLPYLELHIAHARQLQHRTPVFLVAQAEPSVQPLVVEDDDLPMTAKALDPRRSQTR